MQLAPVLEANINNVEVMPGIIDFVLHHNLIIGDIIRPHLIITVFGTPLNQASKKTVVLR